VERAVDGTDAFCEAGESGAAGRIGAAASVVGDRDGEVLA
jgi:hypothetical protein